MAKTVTVTEFPFHISSDGKFFFKQEHQIVLSPLRISQISELTSIHIEDGTVTLGQPIAIKLNAIGNVMDVSLATSTE